MNYLLLAIVAILPSLLSIAFFVLEKYTGFKKLKYIWKQIIIGVAFGGLAIVGTECGIPLNGAQINCRDAAVLTAGLLFGGPAGMIAGVIGGVERFISVYWGISSFTRIACSVSTILAGAYAWLIRKFMLEDHRPGIFFSFSVAIVMEVFHLAMIFFTNFSSQAEAMAVVKVATFPMVLSNGLSVALASFILILLNKEKIFSKLKDTKTSKIIQQWLLLAVTVSALASGAFVYSYQTSLAKSEAKTSLELAISDTEADIKDRSDANILSLANYVVEDLTAGYEISSIAERRDVTDIHVVDSNGIITNSTNSSLIGWDMASSEQSKEFLCLLNGATSYVQPYGPIGSDSDVYRKFAGVTYKDGFVQVGYDGERLQRDIAEQVKNVTKNRHIGTNGCVLVLDGELKIVSSPDSITATELNISKMGEAWSFFEAELFDENQYCEYQISEGYYIVALLPIEEAMNSRNVSLYVSTFMEIIIFAILFALVYGLIEKVVVSPLKKVNKTLYKISNGDLSQSFEVRNSLEMSYLSNDINRSVEAMKKFIDEANKRIDDELEFAKQVQTSSLPIITEKISEREEFDIYASMKTAKEVGGDFYDFYGNESKFNIVIADVSGKGIPAAMFMMRAKADLKTMTEADYPLDQVFSLSNNALCDRNEAGMFLTAWQGQIDLESGVMTYVNAGHNPPLIMKKKTGKFEFLKSKSGFVLGGIEGFSYHSEKIFLEPGDIVFLYTDGITEAMDHNMNQYGEKRLMESLNSSNSDDMKKLCDMVSSNLEGFVSDAEQSDDITMLAFKYNGPKSSPSIHFEKASLEDIKPMTLFLENELEKISCPKKAATQLKVALDEIVSNIVNYGYKKEKGPITLIFEYKRDKNAVYLKFIDEGIPYNPIKNSDPDLKVSLEERQIGGMGIYIVKKTMDGMKYKYEDGKNILTIKKNVGKDEK